MTTDPIEILYQDSDIIAVNKPAGLLTVPGKGPDKQDCLINRMLINYPNSRIVHRLDMATSGIILIPQNHISQSELGKQFQQRTIHKRYMAVVNGLLEKTEGSIELPLICDWPNRPRQKVCHETGKSAQTLFKVIKRDPKPQPKTRVELTPVTGRSHQLRVHMQSLGHPILGDYFYATGDALNASERLLLHSMYLSFEHPKTQETIVINCPPAF